MTKKYKMTKLEMETLNTLEDYESILSECGTWSVHHYGKGGVVLLIQDNETPSLEFSDVDGVISFLKGNAKNLKYKKLEID